MIKVSPKTCKMQLLSNSWTPSRERNLLSIKEPRMIYKLKLSSSLRRIKKEKVRLKQIMLHCKKNKRKSFKSHLKPKESRLIGQLKQPLWSIPLMLRPTSNTTLLPLRPIWLKIKSFKKQLLTLKERLLKLMLIRLPQLLTLNRRLLDRLPKQFKLKVRPNRNYNKVLRKRELTSRLCVKFKLSNLSLRTQKV